jgi:hypothetical protein
MAMQSFNAICGTKVQAIKARHVGAAGPHLALVAQHYGQDCTSRLQDQLTPWLNLETSHNVYRGCVRVDCGLIGPLPSLDATGKGLWSDGALQAWRPTVRVTLGAESISVKCRNSAHLARIKVACRSAIRSPEFSLNWRSAILRAIQPLTSGFDAAEIA